MNPARTLGPDIVTGSFPAWWGYWLGPLAGAALACVVFGLVARERRTLTAKLFHDPGYPSVHATSLPAKPHRGTNQNNGDRYIWHTRVAAQTRNVVHLKRSGG